VSKEGSWILTILLPFSTGLRKRSDHQSALQLSLECRCIFDCYASSVEWVFFMVQIFLLSRTAKGYLQNLHILLHTSTDIFKVTHLYTISYWQTQRP
jgi:hypothetical protein